MGIKLQLDLLRKRETVGCVCVGYFEMYFFLLVFYGKFKVERGGEEKKLPNLYRFPNMGIGVSAVVLACFPVIFLFLLVLSPVKMGNSARV